MKKLSTAVLTVALAIVLITCSKSSATPEEDITSKNEGLIQVNPTQLEAELFELINAHRTSVGVAALTPSSQVYSFAENHNSYMIAQNKLSHDNFHSRVAEIRTLTNASRIGENVARHYSTAQQAIDGWLESAKHKATIEGDYSHATLSVVLDDEGRPYFTQIFILLE